MKKRVYTFIFLLFMVITGAVSVRADENKPSGKCGETLTWSYNSIEKELLISGSGDMYDYNSDSPEFNQYLNDTKVIKIGKNVGKVSRNSFTSVDPELKVKVIIYGDMDDFAYGCLSYVSEIKLYGNADTLAKAIGGGNYCDTVKVKKAPNNNKIKIESGMVLSKNGKKIYYYSGKKKTLKIPNGVTSIEDFAFMSSIKIKKVVLGKDVKKIGNGAFYHDYNLKTLTCNKKLKKIGKQAFDGTNLKTINGLPNGVTIDQEAFANTQLKKVLIGKGVNIGVKAFPTKTCISPIKGFCSIRTSVGSAYFDKYYGYDRIMLKWSKVEGANGYEIVLWQKNNVTRWKQKKTWKELKNVPFKLEGVAGGYWYMDSEEINTLKYTQDNPIYIKVRAYKKTKSGNIKYSKWSHRQILEMSVSSHD